MNIVTDINAFDSNNVYFLDSVKNTIMSDSNFIRIIYSNHLFMLNGIFLKINLKITSSDKYYNKYKYTFDYNINKSEIEKIILIEEIVLRMLNIKNKFPVFRIGEQLINENIKLFSDVPFKNIENQFVLKMSGVWESDTEYGIIYKFMNGSCL